VGRHAARHRRRARAGLLLAAPALVLLTAYGVTHAAHDVGRPSTGAVMAASALPHATEPLVVTASTPSAQVAVLGVKIARTPVPTAVAHPSRRPVPPPVRTTPRPSAHPTACVVDQPCDLSHATWTRTLGCTKAWLAAMRLATCPVNSKTGLPYPLVG
jgi:hypothetical protein